MQRHRRRPFGRWPLEARPVDLVVGNQVHDGILALEQAHHAVEFIVAVVHAFQQRPLVLDRIARGAAVVVGQLDEFLRFDARRARQQPFAQFRLGRVQRQRQRRLDPASGQALERAAVAHGGEDQVLVADAAGGAEQFDGFEHVVQVVRRLAHAHEHDFFHRLPLAREHHLGDDLGAAELAQQAALAGHAESAAHRTADLRRHAHAAARQQHAFHRLAVRERHQPPRGTVLAGMLGAHACQRLQLESQPRQGAAHRFRRRLGGLEALERPGVGPGPQQRLDMPRLGALVRQARTEMGDAHALHAWRFRQR